MLRAQYQRRGPVPQDVTEAVEFDVPSLQVGQALVKSSRRRSIPAGVLALTGEYGQLPPLPANRRPRTADDGHLRLVGWAGFV